MMEGVRLPCLTFFCFLRRSAKIPLCSHASMDAIMWAGCGPAGGVLNLKHLMAVTDVHRIYDTITMKSLTIDQVWEI